MGGTFAFFHSVSWRPVLKPKFTTAVTEGARDSAHSFNTIVGNLSGPIALCTSKEERIFDIYLFICIGDKSVRNLAEKGILRVGDLISNKNELIIKSELIVLNLSPLDPFRLVSLIDALPTQWRESLKTCISTGDTLFNLRDEISYA